MTQQHALLGLLAQTSIHAGTGSQTGIIDLPIQREGHNNWPCIFGSSLKGALRTRAEHDKLARLRQNGELLLDEAAYRDKVQKAEDVSVVFGPPTSDASAHAGAVIVTDARLLLFPTRSLTSQFKWVTCPDALRRYRDDCRRLDISIDFQIPNIDDDRALIDTSNTKDDLFLEEYRFQTEGRELTGLIEQLAKLMQRDDAVSALKKQLVIVGNDSFSHLVNHATPVNAHIALDSLTKTTSGGALWYEETLPPETLLYAGLSANDARRPGTNMQADNILNYLLGLFTEKPYLQIGGNETVGMGWCAVSPLRGTP